MIENIAGESGISVGVVWALIALIVAQLSIQAVALVDLARRQSVRFDKKWLWALIIIFGGNMLLGPILYLAWGRTLPASPDVTAGAAGSASTAERTRSAVDTLYGESDR